MNIQEIVTETNQIVSRLAEAGMLDKKFLAIAIEINQLYFEYLEELEIMPMLVNDGVRVGVDGQVINFKNMDDFSGWAAERL